MGYTHYWRLKPTTLPTEAVLLLGELIWHAYTMGVVQYEFDNPQPPLVSDTEIRFNGVGEQGHETFRFLATAVGAPDSVRTFQFCRTARKPYDQVVMQVLIALKHYLGEAITVTSDGDFGTGCPAAPVGSTPTCCAAATTGGAPRSPSPRSTRSAARDRAGRRGPGARRIPLRQAGQVVDEVRRRVQQDTLGHRGHKHDLLYQARRARSAMSSGSG